MSINQDAEIYAGMLEQGDHAIHELEQGRGVLIQLVHGEVLLNNETVLHQGMVPALRGLPSVELEAAQTTELILFDVPMNFVTPYNLN